MTPTPVVAVLPDDLIAEVISFLPVKSLLRFRCVSKYWKTLISDPSFVKLHLNKSRTRNPLFTLISHFAYKDLRVPRAYDLSVVPYSLNRLIENPPFTFTVDPYYHLRFKGCSNIVGTCNGLILLIGYSEQLIRCFRLWNPATRTISPYFGFLGCSSCYKFTLCCDESTDTYKIVASEFDSSQPNVRILSLGDNVWRDSVAPLRLENDDEHVAVYLCSTLNWLAINGDIDSNLTVEQFVIVSLDLGTETYNQYRLPSGFDEMPHVPPIVSVLGGFLCFSYFYKKTDFVIWQMKQLGVEDSWTQFLKISLQDLRIYYDCFHLVPVLLSEDADTLILQTIQESRAILYNWRDNRVDRTKINTSTNNILANAICWRFAKVYVESLVSTFL